MSVDFIHPGNIAMNASADVSVDEYHRYKVRSSYDLLLTQLSRDYLMFYLNSRSGGCQHNEEDEL